MSMKDSLPLEAKGSRSNSYDRNSPSNPKHSFNAEKMRILAKAEVAKDQQKYDKEFKTKALKRSFAMEGGK